MKFIFPQNYQFKNKLLGFIDYSTVFVNIFWYSLVLILVNIIFNNLNFKIFIFILLCFPLLLFSIYGFNGENIIYIFTYLFNFISKQKLFLYQKNLNFLYKKDIICFTKFKKTIGCIIRRENNK